MWVALALACVVVVLSAIYTAVDGRGKQRTLYRKMNRCPGCGRRL